MEELKRQQMILRLPSSATRMQFESSLESHGESIQSFNVILEVDNIATIYAISQAMEGIPFTQKILTVTGMQQSELTTVYDGLKRELSALPEDAFMQDDAVNLRMDEYLENKK